MNAVSVVVARAGRIEEIVSGSKMTEKKINFLRGTMNFLKTDDTMFPN